jgi:hypothetical protein
MKSISTVFLAMHRHAAPLASVRDDLYDAAR